VFKTVELPPDTEPRSPDDIVVGYDNTMMIAKNGQVFGWGAYNNDDKYQFTPV